MLNRRSFLRSTTLAAASTSPFCRSVLAASLAQLPQQDPASEKTSVRLSSGWEFLREPLGGTWEVWHSKEIATWQPVAMPHCFNAYDGCDPDVPAYRGNGWYRVHVPVENPYTGGRTLLHFEGAGQTTTVYVGDILAGHHIGGYDEFVFDITDAIQQRHSTSAHKNAHDETLIPVAVLCDNSRDLDRMPSDLSDFTLYGGLYRHVNLVYVPAISLEELHIKANIPGAGSAAELQILGSVYNPTNSNQSVTLHIQAISPDGKTIHTERVTRAAWSGQAILSTFAIERPQLWSPSTPQLYHCAVTVSTPAGEYTVRETFGIRHTEWIDHGPFKLNGERLLLRGTHRHEDHAGYAAAMPDKLIEEEMKLIKEMGANFIRLAHYQQSRRVLDLCDRLGILVWEEIPWCRAGVGNETFQEMGRRTLRNMISQHYNHPSILLWGLGNEDDWPTEYPEVNQEKIRAYLT